MAPTTLEKIDADAYFTPFHQVLFHTYFVPVRESATRSAASNVRPIDPARVLRGHLARSDVFFDPVALASAARIRVEATPLPWLTTELAAGDRILYHPADNERTVGTRIFRGLAAILIGPRVQSATEVRVLTCRLAAPPLAMLRVGLRRCIVEQPHLEVSEIEWWWGVCSG